MARKTKAQLAAEAEAEALAAAEAADASGDQSPEELEALLQAGYDAAESDDDPDEEFDLSDLRDADEAGDFDAFKAEVVILCTKVESLKGNDSGDPYVKLTWVVQEGPHEKAHIWDIIMLKGKGVGFGKKKLNQLGLSLDSLKRSDLLGILTKATTKIKREKPDSGYDDKTVIAKYGARVSAGGAATPEDLPG